MIHTISQAKNAVGNIEYLDGLPICRCSCGDVASYGLMIEHARELTERGEDCDMEFSDGLRRKFKAYRG